MVNNHILVNKLPYRKSIKKWLRERYGKEQAIEIWQKTEEQYNEYLKELPDYGGKENGHSKDIYGSILVFAWYTVLPDNPPVSELQDFVSNLFFGSFVKFGKVFDLNRPFNMKIINMIFKKSGDGDRRDILRYPAGFKNVYEPYDEVNHIARYHFTQCPNAEFAKAHDLLHVLPLLCNADYFGIEQLHGTLIRCGTCGNSDICDYCVVGNRNPLAKEYHLEKDENGFLVSIKSD